MDEKYDLSKNEYFKDFDVNNHLDPLSGVYSRLRTRRSTAARLRAETAL